MNRIAKLVVLAAALVASLMAGGCIGGPGEDETLENEAALTVQNRRAVLEDSCEDDDCDDWYESSYRSCRRNGGSEQECFGEASEARCHCLAYCKGLPCEY